ncbi:hypothetical protein CYMTET_17235 [Cymbomonas tetramitiformis]|uniref:Uncharacterized protein n=1 Tax=Cymbomonas tetramitiformis TaxID=36881 RepID=A0AAE0GAX4_9CHLO|nr:hypothetical protein CYMTET_17235 [Cymbomonas tetramitiformis]
MRPVKWRQVPLRLVHPKWCLGLQGVLDTYCDDLFKGHIARFDTGNAQQTTNQWRCYRTTASSFRWTENSQCVDNCGVFTACSGGPYNGVSEDHASMHTQLTDLIASESSKYCTSPPTNSPTTDTPTSSPMTSSPTSDHPTSVHPTSVHPTTASPTTVHPTSVHPTSVHPTSEHPTSAQPTTVHPTSAYPTSDHPTSDHPI